MKVIVRRSGDVTILDVTGNFTLYGQEPVFRETLLNVVNGGAARIVINLSGVSRIDSSAVGELMNGYTMAASRGARLAVAELPADVRRILEITEVITALGVYGSVDEAVRSLA